MSLLPNATNSDYTNTFFVKSDTLSTIVSSITSSIVGNTANWATYPAVSTVNCANFPIFSTSSVTLDGQLLTATNNVLLLNGVPVGTNSPGLSTIADWSYYSALSTVLMNGNGLSNASFIQLNGNQLTTAGNNILVNTVNPVTSWAKYPANSNVDINSSNINNANQLNFITALPGPLTTGATINSLNSLNFSYATALVQQAGINNVNNIAFWNPNFPGVPGAYANMFSKNLTYRGGGATYIATDTNLSVPALYTGAVPGLAGGKIQALGDTATYATINGNACPAAWSLFPCTEPALNLNNKQIVSCRQIDFAFDVGGPFNLLSINNAGNLTTNGNEILGTDQWSTKPAVQDVNMANHNFTSLAGLTFTAPGHTLVPNGTGVLTYNGEVINTGDAGNAANWARYPANANVAIPSDYSFTMNPLNNVAFYPSANINANIYHGEAGGYLESSPDFVSFPNVFQVGTTIHPANEITMTAGALGFGINSDTEINIDATALVNIFTEGVVSIEAVTDFNLTAGLTTFEIGEWNTAALATTFEVASFDVISAGNISLAGTTATMAFGATTIGTLGLGITAAATVVGVASWNLTSAGNVTTVGTQIGFTAGTKFETLSAGDTNLVASGTMNISSLNAINLTANTTTNIKSLNAINFSTPVTNITGLLNTSTIHTSSITPATTTVNIPALNISTVTGIPAGTVTPNNTAQLYYDYTNKKLFYDATPFSVIVLPTPVTFALALSLNEQAFILTSTGGSAVCDFSTGDLVGSPRGFYITVKNGNANGAGNNITIKENGTTVPGPTSGVLFCASATTNASICYLLWDGTKLTLY
jgi:hypothetical protein